MTTTSTMTKTKKKMKNHESPNDKKALLNMVTKYRDNANVHLRLYVNVASPKRDEELRTVATALCPFLYNDETTTNNNNNNNNNNNDNNTDDDMLVVKPLNGGLSNELFTVSSQTTTVLVRIHPGMTDKDKKATTTTPTTQSSVVNRTIENKLAAWLSEQGMAPIFYGRFENGRVEEFYQNVIPLSCHEMTDFGPQIAQAMAQFHQLQAPPNDVLPKPIKYNATIFETIAQWLESITNTNTKNNHHHHYDPAATDNDTAEFVEMLQKEWKWLYPQLQTKPSNANHNNNNNHTTTNAEQLALDFIREIVVTHMDCQSLNILKNQNDDDDNNTTNNKSKDIRLIDFEYAGWNPRAADIANTFCEHCDMNNICANYQDEYPTPSQQDVYFMAYLQQAAKHSKLARRLLLQDKTDREIILATLRSEVGRFTLLSHLGWSIWSVLKSNETTSTIEFDYMKYARHRMDGYQWHKEQFY